MNKISKREQILLLLLGMILLFVLFYVFVFSPSQARKLEANIEIENLKSQKTLMDTTLPMHARLESDLEAALEEINLELDKIEDNLDEAKFERWVFPLLKDRDVTVVSTNFTRLEVASPDASVYVKNDPMYKVKEMINGINEVASIQKAVPTTESALLKSTYTYEIEASYAVYADILDDISQWNTTFFINNSSYDFESEVGTIKIDAYTIDKFETEDSPQYEGPYPANGINGPEKVTNNNSSPNTNPNTNPNTDPTPNYPDFIDENNNNIDDRNEDLDEEGNNKDDEGITFFPDRPAGK